MSTITSGTRTSARSKSRPKRTLRQTAVYYVLLTFGPLSDAALVERYGTLRSYIGSQFRALDQSPSGLRSRRAELVRGGYVEADGEVRLPSGRKATVWKAV